MAEVKNNSFTEGSSGAVGKQIVYKKINGKTFMSKYPDMSQVKYNATQKEYQNLFADAIEYAKSVMRDPARVKAYEKKIHADKRERGTGVYHTAIKAFIKKYSRKVPVSEVKITLQKCRVIYQLTDRQEKGIRHLISQGRLTNAIYQQLNNISKATATRDLQDLCRQGAVTGQSKGAGACYSLVSLLNKEEEDDPEEEITLI